MPVNIYILSLLFVTFNTQIQTVVSLRTLSMYPSPPLINRMVRNVTIIHIYNARAEHRVTSSDFLKMSALDMTITPGPLLSGCNLQPSYSAE